MKKYLLAITASALMFAACSNDENILDENDNNPVTNPVTVNFSAGIASRAIGNTWQKDDLIGISATGTDNIAYTNVQYKVAEDGASATFNAVNSEQAICFQNTGAMVFSAYHPYADVSTTDGKIAKNTAQTQDGVDFLWAKIDNVNYSENPIVNFTFIHKMSQINVKLTPAAGVDISGKDIVIGGLKHDGTFNTANGQATANTGAVPENWTVGTPASNGEFTYTGLIYPQNANSLTLTVGDKTATLRLDGDKFDPGHKYTITATAENNRINAKITIEGNTIQDWEDGSGIVKSKIAFISNSPNIGTLDEEAKAAYNWLTSNDSYEVTYLPISEDNVDANLDQYKMIWAHFDYDDGNKSGGINNAINAYYTSGGAILASREAMNSLVTWGIVPEANKINWVWGNNGDTRKQLDWDGTQGLTITDTSHPLFKELDTPYLILHHREYECIRKMRGWGENYTETELTDWKNVINAKQLTRDSGKPYSITTAEIIKTDSHGCAIAIGDPAYEWFGVTPATPHSGNLYKITANAIDYLISQSTK